MLTVNLRGYFAAIAAIRDRYAGTPVGASESIFALLAPALGLDLITPAGYLTAVSEGNEPTVADKSTADAQLRDRQVAVYVYNAQNDTPDVRAQVSRRPRPRHPGHHHHRDAHSGRRGVPGLAGRPAHRARAGAGHRDGEVGG